MEFLDWLQHTALATLISQSDSIWVYPAVLTLHTIGLGILVGINTAVDLRVLGFAPGVPLAPMEKYFPLMWVGFWINAISGFALFAASAATKGTQPIFYVKLGLIFLGVLTLRLLRSTLFHEPTAIATGAASPKAKLLALASLAIWLGAIVAGRLMAYV